jgi:hypothetical protein
MSDENTNVWVVGTLVKETVKTYWFPEGKLAGQVTSVATALTMFKDFAGRELNSFETGLVLAVPRSGTASVAILMTSVSDPSERNFLKATKREVAAYVLRIRESGRQQNYGDVIGTDGVFTPDGERVGELTIYRKQEPALEKPFLDPIDLLSVGLSYEGSDQACGTDHGSPRPRSWRRSCRSWRSPGDCESHARAGSSIGAQRSHFAKLGRNDLGLWC